METQPMAITYTAADMRQPRAAQSPLGSLLEGCWNTVKERRDRARVRVTLYAMPDRELKDLGFGRSEIASVMVDDSGDRIRAYPKCRQTCR
jgi:uncharacterized protein YjiS (DUF1127 family)